MRLWLLACALTLGSFSGCAATPLKPILPKASPSPVPLTVAEAEKTIAETRDFMVDLYWKQYDWYWHHPRDSYKDMIRIGYLTIELDPHFVEPYTGGAWLLWSDKRHREAEDLYRAGMEANPKNPDLPFEMGYHYYEVYRKRPDLALPLLQRAVKNGGDINMQRALGQTFRRLARDKEALAVFEKIAKEHPGNALAQRQVEKQKARMQEKAGGR